MTVYLTLSEPPPPGASVEAIISMTVGDEPDAADGIEVVGTCSIADGGDAPVAEDATE